VIPGGVWFFAKVGVLIVLCIWARATLPRFRYDALMRFGWKRLFPFALALLMAGAAVDAYRTSPSAKSRIPPRPQKARPLMSEAQRAS
jgi:NADH-quinone oxidoreductase subunit H